MTLSTQILDSEAALDPIVPAWDRLAVEAERPYRAPAWMLAWWRHAAPEGSRLRVIAAFEGGALVGVLPLFVQPDRTYRLLCAGTSTRIGGLAEHGREAEVGKAISGALALSRPRPDVIYLEGVEVDSPWPVLLAENWPGRMGAWVRRDLVMPAPVANVETLDFDRWLASRPRKFRRDLIRLRRRWSELGAVIAASPPARLEDDLAELERLHQARWSWRGGSTNIDPGRRAMLREAGHALVAGERFRLWTIRVRDKVVAAELFVAAGGELGAWGGGFDAEWRSFGPSIVAMAAAVEDATKRGERRVDFGEGDEAFKLRFGDDVEPVTWVGVFPRSARYPLTRMRWLPQHVRSDLRRRIPARRREQIKTLLGGGLRRA
jgi:CelD/BcsL family acetyltransferase involved in cellulose biosynthesis